MNVKNDFKFEFGNAICYSGYREGQSPINNTFPTYDEVKEDLQILEGAWKYIRLYDVSKHADVVLKVIQENKLSLKVMLGVCLEAEVSNPNCPWGADFTEEQLVKNRLNNDGEIKKLIGFAKKYPDVVFAVSAGNEATVEWTDHLVPVDRVISFVKELKKHVKQPVTFCENYVPWQNKLSSLVDEVDFISLHTYPLWEYKGIHEAMNYTRENYKSVKDRYPHKTVIITEAGWATQSNGRGMPPENANEENQKIYCNEMMAWSHETGVLTFIFEAFDENWKGSDDPLEPEKHWGIYTFDRKAKQVIHKS